MYISSIRRKSVRIVALAGVLLSFLIMLAPASPTPVSATAVAQADPSLTFYGGYKTVEGMFAFLDQQVAAHPTLAEKVDYGDTWCKLNGPCAHPTPGFMGYDMYALHITNKNIPGPKPVFWYDAGIHANEITPPELAMRFISWLLDNYETNADAHWLVDYHDIWVVPMLNTDAHHVVEANESTYVQRKNLNNTNGCNSYPPSLRSEYGVDLNRNFTFKWACCQGSRDDPCDLQFHGTSPGSEPETQAVMSQIRKLIPDQRGPGDLDAAPITTTGVVQSMHNFASLNLFPWGYADIPAPNVTDLSAIAAHMSAPAVGGNDYTHCQGGVPGCIYVTDGDSIDWVYGELGVPAFTTELEGRDYTRPYEQVEALWDNNKGMLIYLAKIARTPYLTSRGPDTANLAVEPSTISVGSSPRITAAINYGWEENPYVQNVGGAAYYIDTPPWAGGVEHPMSAADGAFDLSLELTEASIDTSGLAPGRHIIYVRGHGTNNYSGLGSWGPISAVFIDVVSSGGTPGPSIVPSPTSGAPTPTPLPPLPTLPGTNSFLFKATGKTVRGIFFDYWNDHGGLAQQGYPISEQMGEVSDLDGKVYLVQYFERAVFEYHPEQTDPQFQVLLSQLGTFRYKDKYLSGAPGQTANQSAGSVLFSETGKHLGGIFLSYWQTHGGLAQQGYPISDEFTEITDLDGKPYTVQYFERAVFEYHPELAGTPYEVLLSQLGTFRYKQKYP